MPCVVLQNLPNFADLNVRGKKLILKMKRIPTVNFSAKQKFSGDTKQTDPFVKLFLDQSTKSNKMQLLYQNILTSFSRESQNQEKKVKKEELIFNWTELSELAVDWTEAWLGKSKMQEENAKPRGANPLCVE